MEVNKKDNYKKLILAIDFDGTIVNHEFPKIGYLKPYAKQVIQRWKEEGHKIIIWTCRNQSEPEHPEWTQAPISAVIEFLNKNKIPFDTVNSDVPNLGFWLQSRKVYADVYIDDRNMGGFKGWVHAAKQIEFYSKQGVWFE